jgi:nucleotide-binding universal stress UspA family protein
MRIVVGVDLDGRWVRGVDLFAALQFASVQAYLVHCVETLWPGIGTHDHTLSSVVQAMLQQLEAEGQKALTEAARRLQALGAETCETITYGNTVQALIAQADAVQADLIVIGSECRGTLGMLFAGSVGKGLLMHAHQNLLVGKSSPRSTGGLSVVFATDHSEYAHRCQARLRELGPQGIGHLVVLTANRVDSGAAARLMRDLPNLYQEADQWVQEKLEARNQEVCQELASLAPVCESRVVAAHPNEAIRATMTETQADLLILGAQGHSLLQSFTTGSISQHQVIAEPHNVLVLRVPAAPGTS